MDPIPQGFGGRADQKKIDEAARFPWMKLVMDLWTGRIELRHRELSAEEEETLAKLNDKATVRENALANGPQIQAANILMRLPCFPVDEGAIVSYCGLFFVLKSDGVHSRLIFDGRAGNLCLAKDYKEEFVLFSIEQLLELLTSFIHMPHCKVVWADVRHFFYQLSLPEYLQKYYAANFPDGSIQVPLVVPMGFHSACHWAQGITWTTLLRRLPGDQYLGVDESTIKDKMPPFALLFESCIASTSDERPPRRAAGERPIGFICVIMDGFIVVAPQALAELWTKRLKRNFADCNLLLKLQADPAQRQDEAPATPPLRADPSLKGSPPPVKKKEIFCHGKDVPIDFSGVTLQLGAGWRPAAAISASVLPVATKRRDFYKRFAEFNWHLRIRQAPPRDRSMLRRAWSSIASPNAQAAATWSEVVHLPVPLHQEVSAVHQRLVALGDAWTTPEQPPKPTVFRQIVTDAFTCGLGYLILDESGNLLDFQHKPMEEGEQVIREGEAAVWAITTELARHPPGTKLGVLLGVDADTVRRAFNKGLSPSLELQQMCLLLHDNNCLTFKAIRIPGVDNIADLLSRSASITREKILADPRWARSCAIMRAEAAQVPWWPESAP